MKKVDNEKPVIFISWSGKDTASFRMASVLYSILPVFFQSAECFLSDDIDKGTIGINDILENLGKAKIGIICVTKANIEKTWLNFEAGALASAVINKNGRAITLLIDLTTDEYAAANSPIRNFQGTTLDESDLLKMFMSINKSLDSPLKEQQVIQLFDSFAKKQILECNTSSPPAVPNPQANQPFAPERLTKDAKKLLKDLYNDYVVKKSSGLSRAEASKFNDIGEICRISDMRADDIRELYEELSADGYIKYDSDDLFEMVISCLTNKGIKYGEDNFDEPTYIVLLRDIVKKYNCNRSPVYFYKNQKEKTNDFAILKAKGLIKETTYINGDSSIKPTDRGIAEITSIYE